MPDIQLTEINRDTYGHDHRAINKHSDRTYRDQDGNFYMLSKTLDGIPPFYEACGPYGEDHRGTLPRLLVNGREYWGDGWAWPEAFRAFRRAVQQQKERSNTNG